MSIKRCRNKRLKLAQKLTAATPRNAEAISARPSLSIQPKLSKTRLRPGKILQIDSDRLGVRVRVRSIWQQRAGGLRRLGKNG